MNSLLEVNLQCDLLPVCIEYHYIFRMDLHCYRRKIRIPVRNGLDKHLRLAFTILISNDSPECSTSAFQHNLHNYQIAMLIFREYLTLFSRSIAMNNTTNPLPCLWLRFPNTNEKHVLVGLKLMQTKTTAKTSV